MGNATGITRLARSAAELRGLAVTTEDGDVVRRLPVIALLLDGWPRGELRRLAIDMFREAGRPLATKEIAPAALKAKGVRFADRRGIMAQT